MFALNLSIRGQVVVSNHHSVLSISISSLWLWF